MADIDLEKAHYHIGQNIPGYLPDSDVQSADSATDAFVILRGLLDAQKDYYTEQCGQSPGELSDEEPGMFGHCEWCDVASSVGVIMSAIADGDARRMMLTDGGNYNAYFYPETGPDLVFWIKPVEHERSETDEDYGIED